MYGYDGISSTANNVFYNCEGKILYYSAGVGIVYSKPPEHSQAFFLGHSDDIKCMDVCRAAVQVEGQNYPPSSLVATGQVTSHEEGAYVCVWDSRAPRGAPGQDPVQPCVMVQKIQFGKDARGICALSFSPDGESLAVVTMDNQHSVYVYDWRTRKLTGEGKGYSGEPPQVFGAEWNPHSATFSLAPEFVTFGRKHIKKWNRDVARNTWVSKQLSFGKMPLQNICAAAFLPPVKLSDECAIVAGTANGELYLFRGGSCLRSIAAHRPGPSVILADGETPHIIPFLLLCTRGGVLAMLVQVAQYQRFLELPSFCSCPAGSKSFEGVRCLRLAHWRPQAGAAGVVTTQDRFVLHSGGADGLICRWDVTEGDLVESRLAGPSIQLGDPYGGTGKDARAPVLKVRNRGLDPSCRGSSFLRSKILLIIRL